MEELLKKNKQLSKFANAVSKRRGYLLGVFLGLVLIIINVYIGLSVTTLILDEQEQILPQEGISLPVIREQVYLDAKEIFLGRQTKQLVSVEGTDPFRL